MYTSITCFDLIYLFWIDIHVHVLRAWRLRLWTGRDIRYTCTCTTCILRRVWWLRVRWTRRERVLRDGQADTANMKFHLLWLQNETSIALYIQCICMNISGLTYALLCHLSPLCHSLLVSYINYAELHVSIKLYMYSESVDITTSESNIL